MAKTETTVKGYVYTVTSPNGGTVTDAEGKLNKTVDAGDQVTVTAPSDSLTCDDDDAVICKANFKSPLLALRLLGQGETALPAGYTLVAFLESTGTQYIDTGLTPDSDTGCHIETEPSQFINFTLLAGAASENNSFVPLQSYSNNTIGFSSKGTSIYPLQDGTDSNSGQTALDRGYKAFGRITVDFNYKNSGKWNYSDSLNKVSRAVTLRAFGLNIYLFARNYNNQQPGGNYFYGWDAPVYSARFSKGKNLSADFIPALDPTGTPCMFDTVSKLPYRNAGTGSFIAGVGTVAQLTSLLRNLPATGGSLSLSLPAEANTPEVAEQLQACHDTKGWTLTVHEYRPAEASTYSLRRVREVVWCRRELSDLGSYVDPHGYRWQIDRCVAIFGRLGNDPTAYGYTPFDSVDDAAAHWELVPYVAPNAEVFTT